MTRPFRAALASGMIALASGMIALASAMAVSVAAMTATQTPSSSQAPRPPTFRASVEYVEVDARVVDGKGKPVRNLHQEDFRVYEDGQEQKIASFAAIDVPIEPAALSAPLVSSAVAAAAPAITSQPLDLALNDYPANESRVYAIVLDDRQIDAHRTQMTIRVVKDFITRNLGPRDLAAVLSTSGRSDVSHAFTSDKPSLLKAVDGFMGRKLESAAIQTYNGTLSQSDDNERFFEARSSFQAIQSVLGWMAGIHGRSKALLLVSEGLDYNTDDPMRSPYATSILDEEKDTVAAAQRANVTIYPMDPRGLYGYEDLTALGPSYAAGLADARAVAGARESGAAGGGGSGQFVGGAEQRALTTAFRGEVERAWMSLRSIAADTGGTPSINSNKFQEAFDRIVSQQSTYYLLGYYPQNPRRDGKTRRIEVKVPGRGLTVMARRGYREPKGDERIQPVSTPSAH